jgi:hypothetical protein
MTHPLHLEFAYVDDSGDPGMKAGATQTMGLGCVIISAWQWTNALDMMQELRRGIHEDYGIRMRDEVKGEWLVGIKKHFREARLGDGQLRDIYQRHMRMAGCLSPGGVFAVVIDKNKIRRRDTDVEDMAWTMLFQRLRYRTLVTGMPIMLIHDQTSDYKALRGRWRKYRRHSFDPAGERVEAPLLIEDPVSRDSSQSYFIQLADLAAYAATRRVLPAAGKRITRCSPEMWLAARPALMTAVTRERNDAIVTWPRR